MTRTQEQTIAAERSARLAVELREQMSASVEDRLDRMALMTAELRQAPLTIGQRARVKVIALELWRQGK